MKNYISNTQANIVIEKKLVRGVQLKEKKKANSAESSYTLELFNSGGKRMTSIPFVYYSDASEVYEDIKNQLLN